MTTHKNKGDQCAPGTDFERSSAINKRFTRRRSTKDEIPKEKPKEDAKKDAEEDGRYTDLGGKVFDYEEPVAKFNNGPPLKQNNQEKHFNNGLYGAKPAVVNVTENPFVHEPDPKRVHPSDV
ncbi:hypothetical protein FSP39_021798 [Pinctada imbricata]|uniref:Uncharacterized protein n=1 Tax=Pinctada imbricata TaxID=66713 RepID=A0AA88XSI4_PINIB|nr:hypothetical protein FSP39_021798 [Pinctada imbricata]